MCLAHDGSRSAARRRRRASGSGGSDHTLLNFVNLDPEHGVAGQRMGGLLDDDGNFLMLSGLALDTSEGCIALGVGVVTGQLTEGSTVVESGIVSYGWAAGCTIGGVDVGVELRLESDYTAARTGDYDVSSVEVQPPIDESGEEIEPQE